LNQKRYGINYNLHVGLLENIVKKKGGKLNVVVIIQELGNFAKESN
jgi:hypothetical protein